MAQELTNIQEQRQEQLQEQQQVQQQRMNAQQVLLVHLLEMPLAQIEQRVQAEMDENPALESERDDDNIEDFASLSGESDAGQERAASAEDDGSAQGDALSDDDSYEHQREEEEKRDELDSVLDRIDSDDRMEGGTYEGSSNSAADDDRQERVYADTDSFYDSLSAQVHEHDLTERQQLIMDYLIGSLDSDGLLRKDLTTLSDEIAISEYIDASEDEIERVLSVLQSFDPAGIGAQSLQQCLLIQIFRKKPTPLTKLMHTVINEHYDDFTHKRWQKIQSRMHMTPETAEEVFDALRKLNPRPGAALGETMGHATGQVTPDFIITSDDDGNVSFTLNRGKVPQLCVSNDFVEMIDAYRQNPSSMTRRDKEALLYAQQKVNKARSFIDAIRQRRHTMTQTMAAIIKLQKPYILSGDESDLKPMILKDVADLVHLDISTISRVCSSKYAETEWGIMPLKSFFSDRYDTGNGEEVSTREIKRALRELVDSEPKGKPLSDIKLAAELKKQGYPIARRTVAKYREQLGIPTSNLRRGDIRPE